LSPEKTRKINIEFDEEERKDVDLSQPMILGRKNSFDSGLDFYDKTAKLSAEEKRNLAIYYQHNHTFLKMKAMEGIVNIVARLVIFMLLFNGGNKENVFALFYLVGACLAWGATNKYDIIVMVKITRFAIILLLLQYLLLLFNLNKFTSPVPLPKDVTDISILAYIFGNKLIMEDQFIKALGFGMILISHFIDTF